MKKFGTFAITLAAAGYLPQATQAAVATSGFDVDTDNPTSLFRVLRGEHKYTLAGHRSHSSHGSHGSHGSHRSSSGGGYSGAGTSRSTAPSSNSTPPASVMPRASQAPKPLPGNSSAFIDIVKRVQTALYTYGYYTGPIDGIVGTGTRSAISKFQKDWSLRITGTITPEVLDALNIVAK
ncbi:His-Xaa-Ser repeat protein HxsA [Pseudophaeobacter sp. 1A16562]|uniref:His-Xaa-Ser repeat protein HxsA n=1 Tax=Rhodobacterales TaxID=204455 RepID=UPI00237F4413|nr:His-Xaa-Ser repeat protein HxsA [Phaeobacter gallaeciensis]MDE4121835.1 His-Xaa-Ser repeat protein HxsA [Phaeobacter gallaeciensis]